MKPRLLPFAATATVALALVAAAPPARSSENMRCGRWVVNADVGIEELVRKCGEPASKETESTEVGRPNAKGKGTFVAGISTTERWTYDRGSRAFRMVVTIVDGKLKSIDRAE